MKKLYALPLAALAIMAACDDSSKGLFEPEAPIGGPNFHHDGTTSSAAHFVGVQVLSPAVDGKNVRVIWHEDAGVGNSYNVQICSTSNCASGTSLASDPGSAVFPAYTSTTPLITSGHRYYDFAIAVPASATTYYARVKSHGNNADAPYKDWMSGSFTLGSSSTGGTPNRAPTIGVTYLPASPREGGQISFDASTSSDPDGDALTYKWNFTGARDADGRLVVQATGATPTHTYADNGSYTVVLIIDDGNGHVVQGSIPVAVSNVAPSVSMTMPTSAVNEGATFSHSGSFTDPGADTWTAIVNYGDGSGNKVLTLNADKTFDLSHTYADNGTYTVIVTVTDDDHRLDENNVVIVNGRGSAQISQTVNNVAPTIGSITPGTFDPIKLATGGVGTSITVGFADAGTADTHTAIVDCDADTPTTVDHSVNPAATGFSVNCLYTAAGVYTVKVTVTDDDSGSIAGEYNYVVVYDPSAGFVTGGGWIKYDDLSCPVLCSGVAGRASFGFVSKYQKGADKPTGNTRFEFHAGTLAFVSTNYEWLVVSGGKAQFKGTGTINGAGNYGFILTATDGTPDKFRIKIVDKNNNDTVVFDNQFGKDETGSDGTALDKINGNGSIVIHK